MENEINLRDYLEVVAKRWYLVLVSMVIAALLIGLPSISKKSLYEAKAKEFYVASFPRRTGGN